MNLDFSKIEFRTNWASGTVIVTLLVGVITLYLNNAGLQDKVTDLEKSNSTLNTTVKTLSETVSTLKGSQDITSLAIAQFVKDPPGEIKYRLERVEQAITRMSGESALDDNSRRRPFVNRSPTR